MWKYFGTHNNIPHHRAANYIQGHTGAQNRNLDIGNIYILKLFSYQVYITMPCNSITACVLFKMSI